MNNNDFKNLYDSDPHSAMDLILLKATRRGNYIASKIKTIVSQYFDYQTFCKDETTAYACLSHPSFWMRWASQSVIGLHHLNYEQYIELCDRIIEKEKNSFLLKNNINNVSSYYRDSSNLEKTRKLIQIMERGEISINIKKFCYYSIMRIHEQRFRNELQALNRYKDIAINDMDLVFLSCFS